MRSPFSKSTFALCLSAWLLVSCAHKDTHHKIVISVPDQKMVLYNDSQPVAEYYVSTSKYGTGDRPGSYATPLGTLEVKRKIGDYTPIGGVMKSRHFTGEVLPPNAPGRDPIVTRILWLGGLESCNSRAYGRCIYIHGTPEERNIGRPASFGCIRMRSIDIVNLYNTIGVGARVQIIDPPFPMSALPAAAPVAIQQNMVAW